MNSMGETNTPYSTLGRRLKSVREKAHQSLAEVSGAVEIDESLLSRIESGQERPSEEILFLLISHFGMNEPEAIKLWEMANYSSALVDHLKQLDTSSLQKPVMMMLALDLRTQYSDGLDITVTPGGLTLTFTQVSGPGQSLPVAKIGMGREQAEAMQAALSKALLHAKYMRHPKALPPPSED
jgi:transcriptional regulator with XRE-family HTH domain